MFEPEGVGWGSRDGEGGCERVQRGDGVRVCACGCEGIGLKIVIIVFVPVDVFYVSGIVCFTAHFYCALLHCQFLYMYIFSFRCLLFMCGTHVFH